MSNIIKRRIRNGNIIKSRNYKYAPNDELQTSKQICLGFQNAVGSAQRAGEPAAVSDGGVIAYTCSSKSRCIKPQQQG